MMRCKIADLMTDVPTAGGLASRCAAYQCEFCGDADIVICADRYRPNVYPSAVTEETLAYMESAYQFYCELIRFDGIFLHASAVVVDGKAYLFSGHCGAGKSTHTRLWQDNFGSRAQVINDDKPALRRIDGRWMVYGTPWCGKDGININTQAPLAGICNLKKAPHNEIRRLSKLEALPKILAQTIRKFPDRERMDLLFALVEKLITEIPVFELENLPEPDAAWLSYKTMCDATQEAGL